MGGDGQKIRSGGFGGKGNLQKGLHPIGVAENLGIFLMGGIEKGLDTVDRPGFIVYRHEGHQHGVFIQFLVKNLFVQPPAPCGDLHHAKAFFRKSFAGLQNAGMLAVGNQDLRVFIIFGIGHTENCKIVGFGSAGGKDQFILLLPGIQGL